MGIEDLPSVLEQWKKLISEESRFVCEYRYQHPDGTVCHVLASAVLIKDSTGKMTGILRTEQNMTEYKLKESIIIEQNAIIASASRMSMLGEMAGGIAHEINNPLAIISGTIHVLRKMITKGQANVQVLEGMFDDVDLTIKRMTKIINGLRNISRDSDGEKFTPTSIEDCLNDVLGVCSEKFNSHGIELRVSVPVDIRNETIDVMRIQFSQVLLNLLINAFDVVNMLEEKWIKICIHLTDSTATFKIIDCGRGIPVEIQEKIFQPFFTTKEIGKGTGLGLSLSRTIIEKHAGTFKLDKDCENTSLVICIPRKQNIEKKGLQE
ncbi:MAG TPA: PAS domain-containing sensor histidine kinase [Bacteriovoracaceae bacterium]|nr:PAS domain-containing sensor histidine kinase [Bacteriovoracaceae bacterium]